MPHSLTFYELIVNKARPLYLPMSRYISLYLHVSPYISLTFYELIVNKALARPLALAQALPLYPYPYPYR